jgi:hypothetical protein
LAKKRKSGDDESEASSGSDEEFSHKAPRSSNLKRSSAEFETAEASSRKRSKGKSADFEIAQLSGAKRGREGESEERTLRSGTVLKTTILKEKPSFRDDANYIYPSTSGERSSEARRGMGEDVTRDLMDRGPRDPFTPSIARSVESLREGEKPALKKRGVSRNHVLADSRIRVMLEKIASGSKANALKSAGPERESLQRFFEAISGKEVGGKQLERFIEALGPGKSAARNEVIHEVAGGRENLRFGHADINTVVSNEFDPVVVDRRLDPRSMEIRDAVIGLGHKGLIEPKMVLDALSVTKDRFTHQDVTSTVLESLHINERTGSRTEIDHFAAAANPFKIERSRSFDFGKPSEKPSVMQPAREFHYQSRPGPFKFTE